MMKVLSIKYKVLRIELGILVLVSVLVMSPLACQAFSLEKFFEEIDGWFSNSTSGTQVINKVKVLANTGGNVVTDGEIKEGETKSQVYVKNIINGKEITPVDIETEANEVSATSEIKVDGGIAQVHREITIDSEKTIEDYQFDLESSEVETEESNESLPENEGVFNNLQNWWSDFVEDLNSFFQNIFNIF